MFFSTDSVNCDHDKMRHIDQPFGRYDIVTVLCIMALP